MTYDTIEMSEDLGTPIEIYEFTRSAQVWRYTSADENVVYSGSTFVSAPIERQAVEQSQDPGRKPMAVTATKSLPFVQQYIVSPPTAVITLVIRRFHTTDVNSEAVVVWMGRVTNVKFEQNTVSIRGEPIFTALKRPALRRIYQTTCPHLLYGPVCGFPRTGLQLDTTVSISNGTSLSSVDFTGQSAGFYTGGFVEREDSGVVNRRFILSHVGGIIVINLPFPGIVDGSGVRVFPGCDHTLDTCVTKFTNELNYGGFPYIPTKNPFGGSPIF